MSSHFSRRRVHLDSLDQLELLSVHELRQGFPEHYHDTFCISLIRQGTEAIQLQDYTWYVPAEHLSITNPYEIHANPLLPAKDLAFDTLYLSQEIVDHYLGQKGISFKHVSYSNPLAIKAFNHLAKLLLNSPGDKSINQALRQLLQALSPISINTEEQRLATTASEKWEALILFIEAQIKEKFDLASLARFVHLDKYRFAKEFRLRYGLSPINYILMKKVFQIKTEIEPQTDLTQLAYEYNFTDLAHFSRTFKRFIGISPSVYRKSLTSTSGI